MIKTIAAAGVAVWLAVLAAPAAHAQPTTAAEKEAQAEADALDRKIVEEDFEGFQFGVGLSLTLDSGSSDRVTSAQIVNNIVRVDNQDNAIARIMRETHYFFAPKGCLFALGEPGSCTLLESNQWGWGPFIAIQPGEGDIIDSIGAGVMLGFRRPGGRDSFNVGIGAIVDPNARILGDGIVANQPLPMGESEIRYKEKEQWGVVLITSYTF